MPVTGEGNAPSRSQQIFRKASPEIKKLVRDILSEERRVQHMRRRDDIYSKILQFIRSTAR